jgi:hypothetical protein
MLEEMAGRIENGDAIHDTAEHLAEQGKRALHDAEAEASRALPAAQAQSFIALLREIDALTTSLAVDVGA